jgi:murein DD-endopeptidase MepM/ murein hydrolase activator NlpD
MKNSVLITITTLEGSKQYTISQIIKKFIIIFIVFLVFFLIVAFFSINYLNKLVKEKTKLLKQKEQQITLITKKQKTLKKEIQIKEKNLKNKIASLEKIIIKKQELLDQVNDKISDINAILKITPSDKISTIEKLDLAKINAIKKKYILQNIPNGYPLKFKGVTSPFGWRINPILHKKEFHKGIDLRADKGTPIYATANALVQYARFDASSGYGKLIILSHNFGFQTLFGHLSKIVVKDGDFVKKGDVIGYTGNSGLSNGPHLHYEIRYIGMVLNPKYFLKWKLDNFNTIFKYEHKIEWKSLIRAIECQEKILQLQ